MEGAVSASAVGWAAVAAGILALVALILLWRTRAELRRVRAELRRVRAAQRPTDTSGWRTPMSPPDASEGHRGPDGEPAADSGTTAPAAADATSGAANTTSGEDEGEDEKLQPTEVVQVDVVEEPDPLELLLELLEDDEPDTRRDAVVALAGVRGPGGIERLTLILGRDPSAEVRREAVAALRDSLERPRAGPDP